MIRQNSNSTDVDMEFCNIKINGKADRFLQEFQQGKGGAQTTGGASGIFEF